MSDSQRQLRKDKILDIALSEGTTYSLAAVAVVATATVVASLTNPRFNKLLSISAKTSFPVMAGLGVFGWRYEVVMHDAQLFPQNWGLPSDDGIIHEIEKPHYSKMPMRHKVMNWAYDNPFKVIAGLATPMAATVLYTNLQIPHLTLSQRIMHSRVFAQGGVLSVLLATMAFREYMDRNGRFPDPEEEEIKEID